MSKKTDKSKTISGSKKRSAKSQKPKGLLNAVRDLVDSSGIDSGVKTMKGDQSTIQQFKTLLKALTDILDIGSTSGTIENPQRKSQKLNSDGSGTKSIGAPPSEDAESADADLWEPYPSVDHLSLLSAIVYGRESAKTNDEAANAAYQIWRSSKEVVTRLKNLRITAKESRATAEAHGVKNRIIECMRQNGMKIPDVSKSCTLAALAEALLPNVERPVEILNSLIPLHVTAPDDIVAPYCTIEIAHSLLQKKQDLTQIRRSRHSSYVRKGMKGIGKTPHEYDLTSPEDLIRLDWNEILPFVDGKMTTT